MSTVGLMEKIKQLPPETIGEVEDFVDFLAGKQTNRNDHDTDISKDRGIDLRELGIGPAEAAELRASLSSFAEDWDRPEMDVYDKL